VRLIVFQRLPETMPKSLFVRPPKPHMPSIERKPGRVQARQAQPFSAANRNQIGRFAALFRRKELALVGKPFVKIDFA